MNTHPLPTVQEVLERRPVPPNGDGAVSAATARQAPAPRWFQHPLRLGLLAAATLILALVAAHYYRYSVAHESTDDAFIAGDVVAVGPRVASSVAAVLVSDNQHVKKGDVLVDLDPQDFAAKLARAKANLEAARARQRSAEINVRVTDTTAGAGVEQAAAGVEAAARQVDTARSRLEESRAQVAAAAAETTRAQADAERYERLLQYRAVSTQERDNAVAVGRRAAAALEAAQKAQQAANDGLRQAESQLGEAKARLASAKAAPSQVAYSRSQVETAAAEIAQAEAAVRQAQLELSYTLIVAPVAGRITQKSVEPGAYVQVGQPLLSIVPDRLWVVANFKETQLRIMRPGQPVAITVDAYPTRTFQGHVDSIQAGSGAAFSLLPPENATGNYVKVVQRVPVKIVFDDPLDPHYVLGPGMSVVPTVTVR
jgi:membrane fusion protein (multidrug efflux system)